jgi:hypothetical protein
LPLLTMGSDARTAEANGTEIATSTAVWSRSATDAMTMRIAAERRRLASPPRFEPRARDRERQKFPPLEGARPPCSTLD